MVLESGLLQEGAERYELTGPLPPLAIPTTLHDSLMARLDRLAAVKGLAQLAATLGREFAYELLQAVAPWDEESLQRGLHQLVAAEFLYQQGLPPQATYRFKHALIQEAAYQSLLKSTRQRHHQRIAQVLEAHFPETAEMQPELLAHHYTEAGLSAQAIPYWLRAGQRALERSAHAEAIAHVSKGLEVVQGLPHTAELAPWELELQTTLGPALIATKGYAASDVVQAYARARELCRQTGDTPQLFPVLRGLWAYYVVRADYQAARELGEQLLSLAQHQQAPALLLAAHLVLGVTFVQLGKFAAGLAHLEHGMALYDPQQHHPLALRYGEDPGVVCCSWAAWALWALGYPRQAFQKIHAALMLAQERAHPFSLAFALQFAGMLHQLCQEAQMVQARAEALMALSREQGFPFWLAQGMILHGWALAEQGRGGEGLVHIRQGLATFRATGAAWSWPYRLALLADAYGKVGQSEEGLTELGEALTIAQQTGEGLYAAELHRLRGELLRARSPEHDPEASACLRQALDIARRQGAKSFELRAAMSLARLWQQQGKRHEARELLASIYGWFTEGLDTADLQKAKMLLEALS